MSIGTHPTTDSIDPPVPEPDGPARAAKTSDRHTPLVPRQVTRLAFIIIPPVLALIGVFEYLDLFADISLPVLVALILATGVTSNTGYYIWPGASHSHTLSRSLVTGVGSTACMYATGWGPALLLGHLVWVAVNATISGARAFWSALVLLPFMALAGQLAIEAELAPTFIDPPEVHGLAMLALIATMFTIFFVGRATARAETDELRIRYSEERFRSMVQNASDIITVLDIDGDITYASPACMPVLGVTDGEIVARRFLNLVHPEDRKDALDLLMSSGRAEGTAVAGYFRVCHADGNWRWLEAMATSLLGIESINGTVLSLRDVTEHKHLEEELGRLAFQDSLTGLPNRAWFMERLDQAVARARRHGASAAVLFVDLDGFKEVNDTYGHDAGDAVLVQVAERLRGCVRQEDTIARLGGDEFLVLIEDLTYPEQTRVVAERIVEAHAVPFAIGGPTVTVTASVGISGSLLGATPEEIVAQADTAMYLAKAGGKHRFELFDGS